MERRWTRLGLAATGALALPAAMALVSSGSCSLVELYDGAAADGGGGATSGTSATSGSGGSGGGDAGPDVTSPCPPDMLGFGTGVDAGYCIDKLEVTNVEYAKFLAATDAGGPQLPPGRCDWNNSYDPAVPVTAGDDLPVLGVDWCDAYAYCHWAHKRLCGAVGSGPIAGSLRDSINGQWFRACSRQDGRLYPYGNGFDAGACADCNPAMGCDASAPNDQPIPVGSRKTCGGGYTGLYDMAGNAAEWEDGCDDAGTRPDATDDAGHPIWDPRYDNCVHRGGGFYDHVPACLACAANVTSGCPSSAESRSHRPHDVGLRCCLDY